MALPVIAASRSQLLRLRNAGVNAVLSEHVPMAVASTDSSCHHALLAAIDAALLSSGALLHGSLSGVRITVKLRADKTPRAVIVEPELRFEST